MKGYWRRNSPLTTVPAAVLLVFLSCRVSGQQRGSVEVIRDSRVDTLIAKRAELNRLNGTDAVKGFRLQIYTGTDRRDAYRAQERFRQQFPGMRSYVIYNEPNFKVRVGDFRTRLEAERLQQELRKRFASTFIITEKINPVETGNSDE